MSAVERLLMVRPVVGSISRGRPIEVRLISASTSQCYNKSRGMYCPLYMTVQIKIPCC